MSEKLRPTKENQNEPSPNVEDLRRKRIQDHRAKSLEEEDALQANLGAAASDLMMLGVHLHEAIDESLHKAADPLKEMKNLERPLDAYLKITRQWDRLVQLYRWRSTKQIADQARKPR